MIVERIIKKRWVGEVHIGFSKPGPPGKLLSTFGLVNNDKLPFLEINRSVAIDILTALLHKDMANWSEIMAQFEAEALAADFFALFPEKGSQYYTNGRWDQYGTSSSFEWSPMTESTFDGGIVVRSDEISAYIWFDEED